MARLDRDPDRAGTAWPARAGGSGQGGQAGGQPAGVGGQVRRQLQQYRPQPLAEAAGRGHQPLHRLRRVPQPLDVGQVPARLDRHHEIVRGPRPPAREHVPRGQPVEGAVVLDRGVLAGVMLQPAVLGQLRWVEQAAPVAVLPAGGPHEDGHGRYLPAGGARASPGPARFPSRRCQPRWLTAEMAPRPAGTAAARVGWLGLPPPGSHDSQRGRYQVRSPNRAIAAGISTPRTTVASISTAEAMATPNILNSISDRLAKIENTATMIAAALVTTPALPLMPPVTAFRADAPPILSSLIRLRMNT